MTLLAPAALWFLLICGGVIALYLLRIRRQRQTVPSLEFWLALAGPLKPRSLFQRRYWAASPAVPTTRTKLAPGPSSWMIRVNQNAR